MIYVTHDQVEAMTLADRIVVLEFGTIAQIGTPRELYESPTNLFVAQIIGSPKMNVLPCATSGGEYHLEGGQGGTFLGKSEASQVGIRPEHIEIVAEGQGQFDVSVDVLEYLGSDVFIIADGGVLGQIMIRAQSDVDYTPGTVLGIQFDPQHLHFFDTTGLAIPTC